MTNQVKIEVSLTFVKNIRILRKKYPRIQNDMQSAIEQLKQGEVLGDRQFTPNRND